MWNIITFQTLSLDGVNKKTLHVKLQVEVKQQENQRSLFRGVESQTGIMILENIRTYKFRDL